MSIPAFLPIVEFRHVQDSSHVGVFWMRTVKHGTGMLAMAFVTLVTSVSQAAETPLALEGFCSVCIVEANKWVQGSPEFSTVYDGKQYNFPSDEQRQMFLANPAKYVPALGGDCTVCFVNAGKRTPGNIRFAVRHNARLFLFPSDEIRQAFRADPAQFEKADLAADGNCIVCQIEADKVMPGKAEFTAYYNGMRYQFPGDDQRQVFLANPAKYVVAASSNEAAVIPASSEELVVSGTSTCAACEYGVHPLKASNTLGLAITSGDGNVYIVEDAHELYPQVYEDRFEKLNLEVRGNVVKTDGKFVWIESNELKTL